MTGFLSRLPAVIALITLAGCAADSPATQANAPAQPQGDMEGRYSGPVVPNQPGCGLTETGRLRFTPGSRTGRFTFEQSLGARMLYGEAGPGNTLQATPNEIGHFGPGGGPSLASPFPNQPARLEARLQHVNGAPVITGTLTEGTCRWSVTLRRA